MNGIILYTSRYGATKRYAEWLAEETGFECIETKKAKPEDLQQYDTIIFGGGIYASGIEGISFLRKNISKFQEKKVIVFCDGASPYEEKAFQQIVAHNLKDSLSGLPCFYCRGAWDMDRMSFVDRNLCKMLQKAVSRKKPEDYEVWEKALMEAGDQKHDWTDRSYIAPILEAVRPVPETELQDTEWPYVYTDHDRKIARAIVFDDAGYFYFVRAQRDDEFGKATLIETSGGGVEDGEDLVSAIKRELKEELGVEVEVLSKIGVVSDYYNLIHRHNLNHYFLCRVISFGDKSLTQDEMDSFHLSTLKLTYDEAVCEYEKRRETKLGRLIANRELPVLIRAKEMIDSL